MKQSLYIIILVFFSVSVSVANGQLKKAEKLYREMQYADAVYFFEKGLKKDPGNILAIEKLADTYRRLQQYDQAKHWYEKAVALNSNNPETYYYYGQLLKISGQPQKAKQYFEKFLQLKQDKPSQLLGKLMAQSCDEAAALIKEQPYFDIKELKSINTENAEFSPVLYNNKLVFISERNADLINYNEFISTHKPYLSIFAAAPINNSKTDFNEKVSLFDKRLNGDFHDGPITFSGDGKIAYFSRVDKSLPNKKGISTTKIYFSEKTKKKWSKPQPFEYNNRAYNVTHPALSKDGKYLFFASDMPGGQGGMDIYMCKKEKDKWSTPINLGTEVNTPGNEVFPYYNNGVLYFSSDALPGMGGLDIFYVLKSNDWKEPRNLKTPVNSPYDDFGIYLYDKKHGYFSSNRPGGTGGDDIYHFERIREDKEMKEKTQIAGIFEYKNLPADGVTLQLMNEDNELLAETTTGKSGEFVFKKLAADEHYLILVKENEFKDEAKIYLVNSNGKKVMLLSELTKGKFQFKALPLDEYNKLELMEEEPEDLFTIGLAGQIYKKLPGDVHTMEIMVIDDDGNVIMTTTTDENGKFTFTKLKPDETYLFKIKDEDGDFKVIMFDENGNLIGEAKAFEKDKFKYVRLKPDENYITLINEDDEVIKIAESDRFVVSNILYEYRSAELNDIAKKELDKLVLIMKKNPKIVVELSSHTDAKGSDSYNLKLSEKRAEIAKKYIVSRGIIPERIVGKGYGETKPVAPNTLPDGSDNPEGRAKNRRTEIRILKW